MLTVELHPDGDALHTFVEHWRLVDFASSRLYGGHHAPASSVRVITNVIAVDSKHSLKGTGARGQAYEDLARRAHR